jgi:hypothetical protein
MKGTMLDYGDVRFEKRLINNYRTDGCHSADLSSLRVRLRPLAVSRHRPGEATDAHGSRVRRDRRRSRQRGQTH